MSLFSLFCLNFCFQTKENKLAQVIDIQLISPKDFENKHNLLPCSKPKPSLAKRTSPLVKCKGESLTEPIFIIQSNSYNYNKNSQEVALHPVEGNSNISGPGMSYGFGKTYFPMNVSVSKRLAKSNNKSSPPQKRDIDQSKTDMQMEEVKAPELIEVKENEGDKSQNFWQDGGNSANGAGSPSALSDYLKDLHRKLKQAWTPPYGNASHIKVLFRLNKNGDLVSLKLARSCGKKDADESALKAIKESSPFGRLPNNYEHEFLDLVYTFNYTADELKEISSKNVEE